MERSGTSHPKPPLKKKQVKPVHPHPLRKYTLDRYLLRQFLPFFVLSLFMFITLILLIDLFANLVRFLTNDAAITDIIKNSVYYMPKSILYALPVSLLFASAYTLGDLYARNEIPSVLSSGVPFWRICIPLFIIGIAFSFFSFFFEDTVVIPTLKKKNELSRRILHMQSDENFTNVVVKAENSRLIYIVDYYDDITKTLNGVSLVEVDENGEYISYIRSTRAEWTGDYWEMSNPVMYSWQDGFIKPGQPSDPARYNEDPDAFTRGLIATEELNVRDAVLAIRDFKEAGLPVIEAMADLHHRFSFSAVPFVVIFLSVTLGGRFKKNILLMNLLSSLGIAVVYYVTEMITMMCGKIGILPPVVGAWFPVLVCVAGGFFMLRYARS